MSEEPKIIQYLCRYCVSNFIMMLGEEKLELNPTNIISITYVNDYEFNIRPILKVSLRMDIRRKLWVLKNKRDIVVKFEMNMIGVDHSIETPVTALLPVWNQEFSMYFNDDDESIDVSDLEKRLALNLEGENALNNLENENYNESQNFLEVYLFNQQLVNASKYPINEVFTSDTLQQCVGRILTKSKHPKVLMSRFENHNKYKELLVPALPAYKALIYLDQYYGFYKTGALIYYDIDTLYILNTNGKLTALRNGEWAETMFMIQSINNSSPGDGMTLKDDEKIYYVTLNDMSINIQKYTIAENANVGSDAKIVVTDSTTIDSALADQSFISKQNQFVTYTKKNDNNYAPSILKARMEENEFVVTINGQNLDVNAFKPNKTYKITFEETLKQEKYGKYRYRLAAVNHLFAKESDVFMSSTHQIVLKRCSDG